MKNIFILLFVFSVFFCQGQRVRTLTDVQVNEVETLYSQTIAISGGSADLSIDMLCTQDGGTTDGTIALQGKNGSGGNWQTIDEDSYSNIYNSSEGAVDGVFTMTSGAIFHIALTPAPHYNYRVAVTGTANDTTTVSFDYVINYRHK